MPKKKIITKDPKGCGANEPSSNNAVDCQNVISIPQVSSTCWFNAILMSTLFSQYMRGLLIALFQSGADKIPSELHSIVWDILQRRYTTSKHLRDYAYMYFEIITPEFMLTKLNEYNKNKFNFNPEERSGYYNYLYLPNFLEFLGVKDTLLLDYYKDNMYPSVMKEDLQINTVDTAKKKYAFKLSLRTAR